MVEWVVLAAFVAFLLGLSFAFAWIARNAQTSVAIRELLESLPDAALILGADGRIRAANALLNRLLGHNNTEGRSLAELSPSLHNLLKTHPARERWQEMASLYDHFLQVQVAPHGSLGYRLVVLHDVTATHNIADALLVNERRYRALFDNSNDAIFFMDHRDIIIVANPQAADMLGVELDELLDKPIRTFIVPEEWDDSEAKRLATLRGEALPVYERTFFRPNGQRVVAEINLVSTPQKDKEPLIQLIARDVTERKRQQSELSSTLRQITSLQEVSSRLSSSLELATVNETALDAMMRFSQADAAFLAVTQDEAIVVKATQGRYSKEEVGRIINFATGITGRVAINQRAEWLADVRSDPEYFADLPDTQALMAFPLVSHERLVGVVCLESQRTDVFNAEAFSFLRLVADRAAVAIDNAQLYDILTKKLDELQALYDQTNQLERFKSQMIELAAHQMKNAVMQLAGPLDMLEMDKDTLGYPYDELIGIMARASDRVRQIATDIMSLEKIERRYQGDYVRIYNLTDQLNTLYEAHQIAAERKELRLIFERFPLFPVRISADDVQMYEAIANLLSNAIKYTPSGGEVELALEVKNRQAEVTVRDTGLGIAQEHHARLFQMFSRVKTPQAESIEGTGLGLFLFKSIVERFGGEVIFTSTPGEGSTFGFRLPLSDESSLRRPLA